MEARDPVKTIDSLKGGITPEPIPSVKLVRLSLVDEVNALFEHADGQGLTIGQMVRVLRDRGAAMVMLLISLPCMVPGISAALAPIVGFAVALFGFQVTFQSPLWLPKFVNDRSLSNNVLQRLSHFATAWGRPVEKLLRPRLGFMTHPVTNVVIGTSLTLLGIILALPLFIPGSNEVPALVIVVLLLGLLERDGIFVIAGELMSLVIFIACGYLGCLLWRYGFHQGWHIIRHGLNLHRAATQPH